MGQREGGAAEGWGSGRVGRGRTTVVRASAPSPEPIRDDGGDDDNDWLEQARKRQHESDGRELHVLDVAEVRRQPIVEDVEADLPRPCVSGRLVDVCGSSVHSRWKFMEGSMM